MPLIEIRRRPDAIGEEILVALRDNLPATAAKALSCDEGGELSAKDIMIEINDMGPYDKNNKDIHIRVWAHDYPTRRGENDAKLNIICKRIAEQVVKHLPTGVSWYVWVLLARTSYGSDTEDK